MKKIDTSQKHYIYQHLNTITGQCYIGQATLPIGKRWQGKEKSYSKCTKFYSALIEYGWDAFEHNILESNLTLDEANYKEQYYIQLYDSVENGYNIRLGGANAGGWPQESIKHFSEIQKSKKLWCGEKNPRHIHPLIGEENGMYGKHHSDQTKHKISQAKRGCTMSDEAKQKIADFMNNSHPRAKCVLCIETNQVFKSARKAAQFFECGNSTISRVCTGERSSFKGLHFKYISLEEYNNYVNNINR